MAKLDRKHTPYEKIGALIRTLIMYTTQVRNKKYIIVKSTVSSLRSESNIQK